MSKPDPEETAPQSLPRVAPAARPWDLVAAGQIRVDLYPQQMGTGLDDVTSFMKRLGGAAAYVSIAAARLGDRTAIISAVGGDPFGRYVRRQLQENGIDDRYVSTCERLATAVAFHEVSPPEGFSRWTYGAPPPTDSPVTLDSLDHSALSQARMVWVQLNGSSVVQSTAATEKAINARAAGSYTVLDLPQPSSAVASLKRHLETRTALSAATVVTVSHLQERREATNPRAEQIADALLGAGGDLVLVLVSGQCVLAKSRSGRPIEPRLIDFRPLNGQGARDAFSGSLCHGLLAGWPLRTIVQRANAASAIAGSRLDLATAMPSREEIDTVLAGGDPNDWPMYLSRPTYWR